MGLGYVERAVPVAGCTSSYNSSQKRKPARYKNVYPIQLPELWGGSEGSDFAELFCCRSYTTMAELIAKESWVGIDLGGDRSKTVLQNGELYVLAW